MAFDLLVENHHKLMFRNTFDLVQQQMGSKLRSLVTEVPCAGEGAVAADMIGEVTYFTRSSRSRSNLENVPERVRRWLVYRDPIETGQYLDSVDKFRMISDPTSELMQTHRAAIMRGIDDRILGITEPVPFSGTFEISENGIFGASNEGKRPGEARKVLPNAFTTPAASSGLTLNKLRAARLKMGLDDNELTPGTLNMAITPKQHDDLLGILAAAGNSLNLFEQQQLKDGTVTSWMGINFVVTNRLPFKEGSNTIRLCPLWIKRKIKLGVWQDIRTDMWNDTHVGNTPYMRIDAIVDCTRIEDNGVNIIECQE